MSFTFRFSSIGNLLQFRFSGSIRGVSECGVGRYVEGLGQWLEYENVVFICGDDDLSRGRRL